MKEEFIRPLRLTAYKAAKGSGIAHSAMSQILRGKSAVTAEKALRLCLYFGIEPEFWLRLQVDYDLRKARREKLKKLQGKVSPMKQAA